MGKRAIVFSGQGAQRAGMGKEAFTAPPGPRPVSMTSS